MFERVCLVHYHEIGLKGRNRSGFEHRLRSNIDFALSDAHLPPTKVLASRLAVSVPAGAGAEAVAERISRLPGVAAVSVAYRVNRDPKQMEAAAAQVLSEAGPYETFRVHSRRSNTDYSERSVDINRRVGAHLLSAVGGRVDLSTPDVTVAVTVTQGETFISADRRSGIGGLPVGTSGRVVSLLSAGIDSPVATWRMMRRGSVVAGVHFSGVPATNDMSSRLVSQIGEVLEGAGGLARIYVIEFGDIQREVSLLVPPDLRVLIYRRLMLAVAEKIAHAESAKALVTGESLGQVASQTLDNIAATDQVTSIPVLRPLIGSDKLEIIADARALGTYKISTEGHADCCTLYMPRTPQTHSSLEEVLAAWRRLDAASMVDTALSRMSWTEFRCPVYRPPACWPSPERDASIGQGERR